MSCICSFRATSLILMIILKSKHSLYLSSLFSLYNKPRILMTCLKYLAQCPCPRCLTLKSNIPHLGMEVDKNAHQKLVQTDSKAIQDTVNHACQMMFEDGINITSVFIDRLLKPQLLVPIWVSSFTSLMALTWVFPECVFTLTLWTRIQLLSNVHSRSHARVWAWCMEGSVYAPVMYSACIQ